MFQELAGAIGRHASGLSFDTAVPRLTVVATDEQINSMDLVYEPMVCFVATGAKRTTIGDQSHLVEPGGMFISSLEVPVTATFERVPYRAAVIRLDDRVLADLILEVGEPAAPGPEHADALAGAAAAPELIDAVTRWVRLLDNPADIPVLAGRIETEILYRLLGGPFGPSLRQFVLAESHLVQVRSAAAFIRTRFAEPLTVEAVAGAAHMSVASLHRHFLAATGMSPMQFQKRLRLQEARRLLLSGDRTAAITAEEVGYASATQFSREYRRAYGVPPAQDAARLRDLLGAQPAGR
jgi:AraC-like DNA-binding protein